MNITINRDDLLPALDRLGRIVERRNTIPILSNLKLSAAGGGLAITGTDLDMQGTCTVPADVSRGGETTVSAERLRDFVKKLEAGKLTISDDNGKLTVKCGRARATLNSLPSPDFPDLACGEFSHAFDMPADTLAEMIERTAFAISSEETRYYLNGIYLHVAQGGIDAAGPAPALRAVATDGHRLSLCDVPLPEGANGMAGIILPRKAVAEFGVLLKGFKSETVHIEVSTTKLRLTAGATVIATKLIDGTFPDYGRVIPQGNDRHARVEKAALSAAVDRVSTVSEQRGRAVKFSFSDTRLRLSAINPDTGEAADDVDAAFEGEDLEIGFNARYLHDILAALPGATAHMALHDPGSPCLITTGAPSPLYVLMPMRV